MAQNKILCPNCKSSVGSTLRYCPKCGHDLGLNVSSSDTGRDPYEILQISKSAAKDVIDASYKALAKKYHPDGQSSNPEKMRELNWAYEILSSKTKKAKWDASVSSEEVPPQKTERTQQSNTYETQKAGDKKKESTKNPSILTPFGWIVVIAIGATWLLGSIQNSSSNAEVNTNSPGVFATNRPTPIPSRTAFVLRVKQYQGLEGCIPTSQISENLIGSTMCAYGVVVAVTEPDPSDGNAYIFFNSKNFRIKLYLRSFTGISAGDCVAIMGRVQGYGDGWYQFLFIDPSPNFWIFDDSKACN